MNIYDQLRDAGIRVRPPSFLSDAIKAQTQANAAQSCAGGGGGTSKPPCTIEDMMRDAGREEMDVRALVIRRVDNGFIITLTHITDEDGERHFPKDNEPPAFVAYSLDGALATAKAALDEGVWSPPA